MARVRRSRLHDLSAHLTLVFYVVLSKLWPYLIPCFDLNFHCISMAAFLRSLGVKPSVSLLNFVKGSILWQDSLTFGLRTKKFWNNWNRHSCKNRRKSAFFVLRKTFWDFDENRSKSKAIFKLLLGVMIKGINVMFKIPWH